jgi:phosphoserine phosphatase RsbU/P
VTESVSPSGEELGLDGLAEILRRHDRRPAGDLVSAALEDLDRFTAGAPAADDRTLLVARVSG